eukprot:73722-Amphidinium_carterae.1
MKHVADRLQCGLIIMTEVEPLDPSEYLDKVRTLNAGNTALERPLIPRRGPFRKGQQTADT